MKIHKTLRINKHLLDGVNLYLENNGGNLSSFVESAIRNNKNIIFFSENTIKKTKNKKANFDEYFKGRIDKESKNKLQKIAKDKGISMATEIRYRVTASLDMPCFDTLELGELMQTRTNINQLGRLINMAIREKILMEDNKVVELQQLLNLLKVNLTNIISVSSKRLF